MFSQASAILFKGGGWHHHPPRQTPHPLADTPTRQTPPGQNPPLQQTLLGRNPSRQKPPWQSPSPQADTPLGKHPPPGRQTPRPQADGYGSGQYSSYWNAFLFSYFLRKITKLNRTNGCRYQEHDSRAKQECDLNVDLNLIKRNHQFM